MGRRIALFAPTLEGGGAERAMVDIARGLSQRGLPVDLVLVRAEGPYLEQAPEDVRLVDLGSRRTLTSIPRLARYLRRERPGVLVSTMPGANAAAMLAKMLVARRMPVAARRASTFTMELANGGFKERMVLRLERALLRFAHAVITNSHGAADDLKRSTPNASHLVRVIHNPVVWPEHIENAAMPLDHPWFGDSEPPVILSAGRLIPLKDHATLLRAFAEVARSRPARLVVLGEGRERRSLVNLAGDLGVAHAVDFPGFKANPFAYMSRAGVFALTSVFEGSPNVLVQAMACGTPVVSTDCPNGPREILEDGKWGRLVPVGDAPALAEAIVEALDSPVDPARLAGRANDFSAESSIDRYVEVIAECLDSARAPA